MGRRELTAKTSWDDCDAYVSYAHDALALAGDDGDKEVAALAKSIAKVEAGWEALDVERRKKRRALNRANALVRRRDLQADDAVTKLHNAILASVEQDRTAPLFARFFPDALGPIIRLGLESELPELRKLQLKLAEAETPAKIRNAHTLALETVTAGGDAAVKARETAYADQGRTSGRIAAWRDDANAALLGVEGLLKKIAADRRLGTDWVDSFFPQSSSAPAKKKAAPQEPPVTT